MMENVSYILRDGPRGEGAGVEAALDAEVWRRDKILRLRLRLQLQSPNTGSGTGSAPAPAQKYK